MVNGKTSAMSPETKKRLMHISTATLATLLFKRGLRNQFIQGVVKLSKDAGNMVGPAFTLRYMPAREDRNGIEVFRDRKHPQRQAIEQCPAGAVLVIDSRRDARAASAGGILVSRLWQREVAGVVTDGGFRDSDEISRIGISAYHHRPSAPTNLTLHEAIDINVPIGCGEAPVFPGDVMVGDADGVIVIPSEMADEVAVQATEMTIFEDYVMASVKKGQSILGLYPPTEPQTKLDFETWREKNGL